MSKKKAMFFMGLSDINLLLDDFTDARIAYSLRALRSAYSGNCIKVRRSSDNATLNIGFASGVLDVASLEAFCSATDGFVERWYDQSGNAIDAIQTTTTLQPKIVASGSVETTGGNPAIYFNGSNQMPINHTLVTPFAFAGVINCNLLTRSIIANAFWSTMSANKWAIAQNTNIVTTYRTNDVQGINVNLSTTQNNIMTLEADNTGGGSAYGNGSLGSITTPHSTVFDSGTVLGGVGGSRKHIGFMQEIVFWHNDKSSEILDISGDINNYYSYY